MSENKSLPVLGTEKVFDPIRWSDLFIRKVEFVNSIPDLYRIRNKWDVSDKQDKSIMAWKKNDTLKISGNGPILANEDCSCLFYGFENVVKFSFNDLLDTSGIKIANNMFDGCESLKNIDVSSWNTQNLQEVRGMFADCHKLKKIDVVNWNMQNLRDASCMFIECGGLNEVDVSNWNTEKLQEVRGMFEKCRGLEYVDVSNWNTKNLQDASGMFWGCYNLENIDVSKWNTQKLQNVVGMFLRCENLEEVISNDSDILEEFEELKKEQKEDSYSL